MSSHPKHYLTPEEYLEIERKAEYKSEYYAGEMFAMSGASMAHNRICAAIMKVVGVFLDDGPCEVFGSDMKVGIPASDLYTYPDATVCCNPQLLEGTNDTLLNPVLIVEVLSPSTEAYDRGDKFTLYRSISSLREYLLISSERIGVELRRLRADGTWSLLFADRREDTIELESIGFKLALADLYKRVEFGAREPGMRPIIHSE